MRTIKELLQIMLDNPQCFNAGLCLWVFRLQHCKLITLEEEERLDEYIENNRPPEPDGVIYWDYAYWFPPGDISPRIEWIKYHISIN